MVKSKSTDQENVDKRVIEDINQLKVTALGEGAAVCQVCGQGLREGALVTAYVFRPAGSPAVEVGYVLCGDDRHEYPAVYTLGVRELMVGGRVGRCFDVMMQSSWPVLLAPVVLAVSEMDSKTARAVRTAESSGDPDRACATDGIATVREATIGERWGEKGSQPTAGALTRGDKHRLWPPSGTTRMSLEGGDDDGG
jgi:hypothetical protein